MTEPINVLVTDERERDAVADGEIEGDVYDDHEVWAKRESLEAWRQAHPLQPISE